ncbi:bile acid:sodium symporter family protein [Helicobacter sp. 11S03491-1]|uniref:bile acid:sodium symporter family protein n=1 Tax=Helicobacter sp. 11S03491-1 TaxID=1476196 RepID=UPI000BA5D1C3|nr:bile acid:sodium symporter family protein [Helicobacter sp. 11S03491-1]PAF41560.1 sodium transporter [Helicobacter sp. 11S03491-1]
MKFLRQTSGFVGKNIAVIVIIFAALALFFPQNFNFINPGLIAPLLGVIMFGMGLTIRLDDFKILFFRPKEVIIGVLAQFIVMPLLAFVLVKIFHLSPDLAIGVILVGTSPGGTSSNVITYLSKGDVSLSVAITSCTTLLAPIMTPLLTYFLAGESIEVNIFSMFLSIIQIIIIPIFLGIIVHKFLPKIANSIQDILPLISTIGIVAIIISIVSANASKILISSFVIISIVILHNIFGYLIGFLIGKVTRQPLAKIKALSIEVGMQNSGLAASLAITHFAIYPLAAVPAVIFSVWHNISGGILAGIYSRMKNTPHE